ncbi:hypothetical protein LX64_01495 [Chitinophaga skermanii]|uniref:Uncharacterized protein n=1 Tax=Chitinophaga skermanii TaxID=331697 RepID=A0A327QWY7_9BACT|nr:hypothetical protein [Chitinophaga skermanii]RAJ08841.1 hypothetical protein LX64_01495 [Chitinophaga skermanii]
MYAFLLYFHSYVRWLVLLSLLFALFRAYRGWKGHKSFLPVDDGARKAAVNFANLQFTIGVVLYIVSPIVKYFWGNFVKAEQMREFRFFGMEHITMMTIAVAVINITVTKSKRKSTDHEKFRIMAIGLSIALFLVLTSIPWGGSPLISRPYFRGF